MNKQELVNAIAEKAQMPKLTVEVVLSAQTTVITDAVAVGDEVTLPGLGKLKTAKRAARTARNPQTGETVAVKARTAVKFSVAKALKDAVA